MEAEKSRRTAKAHIVGGHASDRYMTDPSILAIVAKQWPTGIDLDPCHDEHSFVTAANTYDIRRGENGAALPWTGRVWCNPPYSNPTPFIARAQQHGQSGGEALLYINTGTDTITFQTLIFPYADLCFLAKRQRFYKVADGETKLTTNPLASVVAYFGSDTDAFFTAWSPHGAVCRRLTPANPARMAA